MFPGYLISIHQGASGGIPVHSLGRRWVQTRRASSKETGKRFTDRIKSGLPYKRNTKHATLPLWCNQPSCCNRSKRTWNSIGRAQSTQWTRRFTQMRRRPLRKWWIMCCGRWLRTGSRLHSNSSKVTCGERLMLQGDSKASKWTDHLNILHSHQLEVFHSSWTSLLHETEDIMTQSVSVFEFWLVHNHVWFVR